MSCINEDKRGPVISIPRGDDKIYPIDIKSEAYDHRTQEE